MDCRASFKISSENNNNKLIFYFLYYTQNMNIAIIGGGASGFFLAINLKKLSPNVNVTIFEKKSTPLSKVAISGGGRCNLTNSFNDVIDLSTAYPRGDKLLKRAFKVFNHQQTYEWFERQGVSLVTQDDNCVFPRSQSSKEVINCLLELSNQLDISIKLSHGVKSVEKSGEKYEIFFDESKRSSKIFDIVAITTGGSPRVDGLKYLENLPLNFIDPIPSLFTFNIPSDPIKELMGTVIENATVSLQGTKIKASGALLITHWGMSGPAILKLSSYAARLLSDKMYRFNISVNWVNEQNNDAVVSDINRIVERNPQKKVINIRPYDLPSRLWLFLLKKANIPEDRKWDELGRKGVNKIMNILTNDDYLVHGKGVAGEEFVTCGGVSLDSIDFNTMESKSCKNLYLAGEVLNIDAITGGFNLQSAWTTGYIAAVAISKSLIQIVAP